ncbi:hypothetical protein ISCGN_005169 [Ixodes scapularis]
MAALDACCQGSDEGVFFRRPMTSRSTKRKSSNGQNNWVWCLCSIVVSVVCPPGQHFMKNPRDVERRLLTVIVGTAPTDETGLSVLPDMPAPFSSAPRLASGRGGNGGLEQSGGVKESLLAGQLNI